MSVKIATALPKGSVNGLDDHNMTLGDTYVVVALCHVAAVTEEYEQTGTTDTLRIRAIEAFERDSRHGDELARKIREQYEDRTGNRTLPLDEED